MQTTRWSYVFSYRIHGPQDTRSESTGTAHSPEPLDEFGLQDLVLGDLLLSEDARDNGWDRTNTVITRFHYAEMPPVPVPDVSQADGTVSRDESPAREDTDGV